MGSELGAEKESAQHGYYLSLNKHTDGRYHHRVGPPLSEQRIREHEAYCTAGRIVIARKLGKLPDDIDKLVGICAESLVGRPNSEIYRRSLEDIMAAEALLNREYLDALGSKAVSLVYKKKRRIEEHARALLRLDKAGREGRQLEIEFKKL